MGKTPLPRPRPRCETGYSEADLVRSEIGALHRMLKGLDDGDIIVRIGLTHRLTKAYSRLDALEAN